uniref:TPPP family protein n=1 Tax=Panagrellus redivivus TaxID=6233 RepID=A0A7E4VV53_PANRE
MPAAPATFDFKWQDEKDAKKQWETFTKFGSSTATEMTGKNFDKWLKDAGIIDGKTVTTTVTGIAFSKVAGPKKRTNFAETKQVLVNVASEKAQKTKKDVQEELDEIIEKLSKLEAPTVNSAAKANTGGVYSRLTDHTKYTGAHKERFDAEGKGKGKAGREESKDTTGYVGAYKNAGTYDKAHKP